MLNTSRSRGIWRGELYGFDENVPTTRTSYMDCHWLPQTYYTDGPSYVADAPRCDQILRIENLDDDWSALMANALNPIPTLALRSAIAESAKLQVATTETSPLRLSLETHNQNNCSMQVGDLDAESREGLSQLYAADFDLLNYSRSIRGRGAHRGGTEDAAEGSGEESSREEGLRLREDEVVVVARD